MYNQGQLNLKVPVGTNLAKHLESAGINLGFDCGYSCSCGTCAIRLSQADYQKVREALPVR